MLRLSVLVEVVIDNFIGSGTGRAMGGFIEIVQLQRLVVIRV